MCELLHTKNHHYFDGNNKGPLYQCAQTPTAIHPLPIPGVGVCTGRLRPPRAGWPRPAARAAGDAQGDAREPAAWELLLNDHLAHAEKGSNLNIAHLPTPRAVSLIPDGH